MSVRIIGFYESLRTFLNIAEGGIPLDNSNYALQMQDITVEFPGVLANNHVSIDCKKGEVLGLLGENGAGKTTLMNVLYGLYEPTTGKVFLDGKEVHITSPLEAIKNGIGMVHQHFKLVDTLSVIENVILGITAAGP